MVDGTIQQVVKILINAPTASIKAFLNNYAIFVMLSLIMKTAMIFIYCVTKRVEAKTIISQCHRMADNSFNPYVGPPLF